MGKSAKVLRMLDTLLKVSQSEIPLLPSLHKASAKCFGKMPRHKATRPVCLYTEQTAQKTG